MTKCAASGRRLAGLQTIRQSLNICGAGQCWAAALPYLPHQSLSGIRWTLLCLIPPLHWQRHLNKCRSATSQSHHHRQPSVHNLLLGPGVTCSIRKLLLIRAVHMQRKHPNPLPLLPSYLPPLPLPPLFLPLHHYAPPPLLLPLQMAVSQLRCCSRGQQGSQMHMHLDKDPFP